MIIIFTVTTYKHPLLAENTTNHHPVMIGPSIIDSYKTFESYFSLSSNIVRLEPSLQNLKVFGTDGEVIVYRSMQASFSMQNICSPSWHSDVVTTLSQRRD